MGLEHMVANKHIKLAALAFSLGIALSSGINEMAVAKSSKKTSKQATTSAKDGAPQGEEQTIRANLSNFSKLLAAGDAKGLAALWAEDGEYVDEDGYQTKGRKEIEQRMARTFSQDGRPQVQMAADTVKFLAPTVALVEGTVEREHDGQTRPASHFSLVFVKGDSGWLLTRVAERVLVATSNYEKLRHFDWIIGDWDAKSTAASVHMKAEWVPSKNFILCKYETKKADGGHSIDMQIIGWDPILNQPRSWHFDSSGGFGQGLWSKVSNQWICDTTAVESDASETKARNVITVTSPNAFTWSSTNRSLDGMAVGDAPSLSVERVVVK
jgi:uncharacterized protein (TIGR02246 family)